MGGNQKMKWIKEEKDETRGGGGEMSVSGNAIIGFVRSSLLKAGWTWIREQMTEKQRVWEELASFLAVFSVISAESITVASACLSSDSVCLWPVFERRGGRPAATRSLLWGSSFHTFTTWASQQIGNNCSGCRESAHVKWNNSDFGLNDHFVCALTATLMEDVQNCRVRMGGILSWMFGGGEVNRNMFNACQTEYRGAEKWVSCRGECCSHANWGVFWQNLERRAFS